MEKIKPMLSTLVEKPFSNNDWIFEIKWDGYRAIADTRSDLLFYSRYGNSFAEAFKEISCQLVKIREKAVFDGEIVVFDNNEKPSFELIQNYQMTNKGNIAYIIFDLIFLNNENLINRTLVERKKILNNISFKSPLIRVEEYIEKEGESLFKKLKEMDYEGMMAKRKESLYFPGKRTKDWLKIKIHKEQEAIIVGYTEPAGARLGFGSLILAVNDRGTLRFIGNVGTGFDNYFLESFTKRLKNIEQKNRTISSDIEIKGAHWVRPEVVAQVKFQEWTKEGRMRQPVFLGIRNDKKTSEVIMEVPEKYNEK